MLLTIGLNQPQWEYGVRALLMSFFPHQEFAVEEGSEAALSPEARKNRLQVDVQEDGNGVSVCYWNAEGSVWNDAERLSEDIPSWQQEMPFSFASQDRRMLRAIGRTMYRVLSRALEVTLPWGTLSGIRPTKLPMAMLNIGLDEEAIHRNMQEEYLVSEEKTAISLDIAKREKRLLDVVDGFEGYSLYVGIPFCPSTCLYCSFTSYSLGLWRKRVDEYLDALEKEIVWTGEAFAKKRLDTIYIGGGTPTTLSPEQLDRLCTMIEQHFDLSHLREFTVEAGRPDSITEEKLRVLRQHPVDRISINPQTMKQATLDLIGRRHSVEQVEQAYRLARSLGFDNINMDLILGLPGETAEDVAETFRRLQELAPDNVTVHSLAIKRAARLNLNWEQYADMPMENTKEIMDIAYAATKEMGLVPYYLYRQKNMAGNFENVGYATPGKEGLYNILIMEEVQSIVALGAGASTKAVFPGGRIERCENVKDVGEYISRIDEMIARKCKLFAN